MWEEGKAGKPFCPRLGCQMSSTFLFFIFCISEVPGGSGGGSVRVGGLGMDFSKTLVPILIDIFHHNLRTNLEN